MGGGLKRVRARRAAVLVLPLALAACAGAPFGAPAVSQEEQRAFDRAVARRDTDPGAARAALEAFLAAHPEGPLADDAELALGEIARKEGDADAALERYGRVITDYPRGDAVDLARVRAAELERARGDVEAARAVLARARLSRLEPEDRHAAYRLLAELAPDPVARVHWLALLRSEVAEDEVGAVDSQIDALLTTLDADDLERVASRLRERPPAARVELARAERALDSADLDAAERALERARRLPLAPRYAPRLAALEERLRRREAGPIDVSDLPTFADLMRRERPETGSAAGSLGVVLPLSGPFAHFGEMSLYGVLLAAGVFDPEGSQAVRVVVRDSGGHPARAAAAVRELAEDESIVAVVGPLLFAECEAAAAAAQHAGLPLLALTAREEVARDRDYVFRLRTRPEEEVQLLVDRARQLGAERFAILYRNDAYGVGLRSLFWDTVEQRGGRIVGVASYDPQATDFAEPIRRLVGYTLLGDEEKQLIRKREGMRERARRLPAEEALELRERAKELTTAEGAPLPPIVDFDALFIPESHENVVLIAPQLAFHEVQGARLLGPAGWYDPELVRLAADHLEGALFAAHFYPESPVPWVQAFTADYEATYAQSPEEFGALAYDAANLVLVQLARGRDTREAVRDGVLGMEAYGGVSGVLEMRADGNAHKRPYLLGVEKGHVVQFED